MNLVESLQRASDYLRRYGVPSSRLDAELLLCHITDMSRMELYLHYDRPLSQSETDRYRELLVRRAARVPLQLLTGTSNFRGLGLKVRPGVFIPRQETEVLVEVALETIDCFSGTPLIRVLDVGTGCGPVALGLARERDKVRVVATDVERVALDCARDNVAAMGMGDKVEVVNSDLFSNLNQADCYHLIVSNPPYVTRDEFEGLPPEVAEYDPEIALDGGVDGMDVIRAILEEAPSYMEEGGYILLEMGESQSDPVGDIVDASPHLDHPEFFHDLAGKLRVARVRRV